MRRFLLAASAVVIGALAAAPSSRGDDAADVKARIAAIEKGIEWLKQQQAKDGSFDDAFVPFTGAGHMKLGTTALGALAFLKSGVAPDEACIKSAFDFMQNAKIEHCYDAGVVLMAIEARYNWEPPHLDPEEPQGQGTHEKKDKKAPKVPKLGGPDLDLAQRCVQYLV